MLALGRDYTAPPPGKVVVDEAELAALRSYLDDVARLLSEPGAVTKAELRGARARYEERTRP